YFPDGEPDDLTETEPREVTREELLNTAKTNLAAVRALCSRGLMYEYKREVGRLDTTSETHEENIKPLSPPQAKALSEIQNLFRSKATVLLHGVTSSGKTEIYIHLIRLAIERGEQVLYLLPEIALTIQIMQRLRRVFGNKLGIYHSRYSDAERVEIWKKQLSDEPYQVILGARSAVYLPFRRLGLVIVDEEHESSFKQQEPTPRYHARSAALMLAKLSGAKTLLGTATPSLESFYNAQTGKYGLVRLTTRYEGLELPEIEVVDVKDLRRRKIMRGNLSPQLCAAIREAFAAGRQVILFQNRRGYSREIECRTCGWVPKCTNCDVSLTLHRTFNLLTCHYCGYTYPIPEICPACEGRDLLNKGAGTERIEDELAAKFPEARTARMDLDSTRSTGAYDRILTDFAAGRTNVLIGTQMVTKGLDFDRVAVVGILDADSLLNKPDFRAHETAFQMMTQVSGRAGRKGKRGRVFLQTKKTDLPVIRQIVEGDYDGFYASTVQEREYFNYPPYSHVIRIELRHAKDHTAESAARMLASILRQSFGNRVLGPDKPAVARVKNQNIRTILLKIENNTGLSRVRPYLRAAKAELLRDKSLAAVTVLFDVDPL
ncbi:MAG: primosomal protein N', partial [Prevotella sp.]|nr:primosomal protein N' [Prevotella sp.]